VKINIHTAANLIKSAFVDLLDIPVKITPTKIKQVKQLTKTKMLSDKESLSNDWSNIGKDFEQAIKKFQQTIK